MSCVSLNKEIFESAVAKEVKASQIRVEGLSPQEIKVQVFVLKSLQAMAESMRLGQDSKELNWGHVWLPDFQSILDSIFSGQKEELVQNICKDFQAVFTEKEIDIQLALLLDEAFQGLEKKTALFSLKMRRVINDAIAPRIANLAAELHRSFFLS